MAALDSPGHARKPDRTAAPTTDGSVSSAATSSFSTASLTTTKANDIIVFVVFNEGATQRTVSSITSSGCNLALYNKWSGVDPGRVGFVSLEIWWGFSAVILTSHAFTITMSGAFDDGGYVGFGVNGVNNHSSPWDTNTSLAAKGTGGTQIFSTSQSHDLLISAFASSTNNSPTIFATVPGTGTVAGWGGTPFGHTETASGTNWAFMNVYVATTTVAGSGLSVGPPAQGTIPVLAQIVGALTGRAKPHLGLASV